MTSKTKAPDLNDQLRAGKNLDITRQLLAAEAAQEAVDDTAEHDADDHEPDSVPPVGFDDVEPIYDRPLIKITTELHNTITAAIDAISTDRNVFVRDGQLVDVVRCAEAEHDSYLAVGAPKIRVIALATMRERLTRCAVFEKFDGRKKGYVSALPPDNVASGVLARGEYPTSVRTIVGILEAPSMRPDGSLIQQRGYDAKTGYLYEPSIAFPEVPHAPTQDDAKRALAEIYQVFADFPFALEAGRAGALAAILTIIARPAILGAVPAFIVDASTRGTGKSLTTDVIGVIATGRATAKMSWPPDDIELEKVLGGYAMRGAMVINFDNVVRPFGGGPLDRCLTATDTVELRVLGKSEVPAVLWRAVVLATGNNVDLTGDTSRRCILARLESPLEHPEDRADFKITNLLQWCRQHRPQLVVAALTILRAWHVAGKPDQGCKRWGSFEDWSEFIPHAIVFAGGANALDARPAATDREEPEKAALVALLDGLQHLDGTGGGMSAQTIIKVLYPAGGRRKDEPPDGHEGLREAIEELTRTKQGTSPSSHALGCAFRKFKQRVVGGRSLNSRPGHQSRPSWFVNGPGGRQQRLADVGGNDGQAA